MAAPETLSQNQNRHQFLFHEIKSGILSEEDDGILAGFSKEKLVCFDTSNHEPNGEVSVITTVVIM